MKKIKRIIAVVICCMLCIPCITASATESNVTVRYVKSLLPQIRICAALPQTQSDDVAVRLGDETLKITSKAPLDKNSKTCVYILLDLSTSMQTRYFDAAKEVIAQYIDNRGANETVVLVAFGKGEPHFYSNDEAKTALQQLQPDNAGTELNQAVLAVLQDAQAKAFDEYDYMYGIMISDGTEYSKGSATAAEIQSQLKLQPMALFGLCADFAANEDMQAFRTLAHETGGTFDTFGPKNIAARFSQLQSDAENVWVLTAQAAGNTPAGDTLYVKSGETTGQIAYTAQSETDNTPPAIDEWQYAPDTQEIVLQVSEPLNAQSVSSSNLFLQKESGKKIYPDEVNYDNENTVTLHFAEPVPNGAYTIQGNNVTDNSDSANPLTALSITIANSRPAAVIWLAQYWYIPLSAVLLVLILVVLIVFLKIKKQDDFRDVITFFKNKRIVVNPAGKPDGRVSKETVIYVESDNGSISKYNYTINTSAIFGRGEHCDFVIQDNKMSRQHFSVGIEKGKMCIQDLGATNGTYVNGSRVQNVQILHDGDKIFAGTSSITIEFQE